MSLTIDKTISFPCTLEDFGEGFEYSEDTVYLEESEITAVDLLYNDSIIAFVSLRAKKDDKVLKDNELTGFRFSYNIYEKQNVINNISVGGVTFLDTKEKVLNQFGEPSEQKQHSGSDESYVYYIISDDEMIRNLISAQLETAVFILEEGSNILIDYIEKLEAYEAELDAITEGNKKNINKPSP